MPTYQYACTECGHSLEQFQSFTDDALTECPSCGGKLRKIYNAVGVVFKGSGFYRNDSREPPKESAANGSGDKAGSGSKDSGSKDSGSKDSGSKDSGSKGTGSSTSTESTSTPGKSSDKGSGQGSSAGSSNPARKSTTTSS